MNLHKLRRCLELAEELVKESGVDFGNYDRRIISDQLRDIEWELYEQTKYTNNKTRETVGSSARA